MKNGKIITFVYSFVLYFCSFVKSDVIERRLIDELFSTYDPLARPVLNVTQPVVVTLGVILQQIVDVVSLVVAKTVF